MYIELLAFDCDGTLLDTHDVKGVVFQAMASELFGLDAGEAMLVYHRRTGGTNRSLKFRWLFEQFAGQAPEEAELLALNQEFYDRCFVELQRAPLVAGTLETLERWHGVFSMRVVSAAPQNELQQLLETRGLSHFFDGIHGYPPTKIELLQQALAASGASGLTTVMIGDGEVDRQAAEKLDAYFYGVGSGWSGRAVPYGENLTGFTAWLKKELL